MKGKLGIITLTIATVLGVLLGNNEFKEIHMVCINEVRSTTASKDKNGYFGSDYIEVYNPTNKNVSLEGWHLSDDESNLLKSEISDVIILPKSYAVFHADGGEKENENSVSFKISSLGEKIFLSNSEGDIIDSVLVPKLKHGEVYAREKDGQNKWKIMEESYLKKNDTASILPKYVLNKPVFSHASGFYEEAFELELCCNMGEEIYYTLDGSVPTKASNLYKEPIRVENISNQSNVVKAVRNIRTDWRDWYPASENVDKAVVVRAISMANNNRVSDVATNTYFIDLEEYKGDNIISVVSDYDNFFGEEGIFVTGKEYDEQYLAGVAEENLPIPNFAKSGRQWEILGNLQFFYQGNEICNQLAGIRTYGGSTRYAKIKRMSFYSRNEYSGSEYFDKILLAGRKVHSMGTNRDIGNLILPQLVCDRAVAVQGIERAKVFLNGEYYSDTDLIEKYSKNFLKERFGVQEENVVIFKDGEVSEGNKEYELFLKWLLKQIKTKDLSLEENYEEIKKLMDVQSYIDYICANVYLCNMDVSQVKNYMFWRSVEDDGTEFGDTRFRWMLYDMGALDYQINPEYYQVEDKAEVNSFSAKGEFVGHSINQHELYQALKNNQSYCKQFVLSFMDMANVNFSLKNVEKVFERWGFKTELYGDFFEKRYAFIVPYMAEEFGLTGTLEDVTLKTNHTSGGTIQLNTTIPDLSEGSWTGKYYTDYPVTVTAVPADGYEFVGWSGSVSTDSATIEAEVVEGGITLEAVFEKIAD